jgi:hypothetical protein
MPFDPVNGLEVSLIKAATDPAHRAQFYRVFVAAEVFVIEQGPRRQSSSPRVLNAGENICLTTLQRNGQTVVPIFSSLLRVQSFAAEGVNWLALNALEVLRITKGAVVILNPGADYGKEFTAAEIASILDGSLWKPTNSYVAQKETKVLIGQPANYPHALVAVLSRYFSTAPEVERAYLAQYLNPECDQKSHSLVAAEVTQDWDRVMAGAGLALSGTVIPDPPVDFLQLTGKGGIEDHFRSGVKPFYERNCP